MAIIPVSMVDDTWFERDFAPAVGSAIATRSGLWIVVEHPDEGDLLLRRVRSERPRDVVQDIELAAIDPGASWMDVVGNGDDPGMFTKLRGAEALFVYGGAHIHHSFLASWSELLRFLSANANCAVVSTIHRRTVRDAPHLLDNMWSRFDVPTFGSVARGDRVSLTASLLARAGVSTSDAILAETLVDRGPASRTELERWIETCAQSAADRADGTVDLAAVARLPRHHSYPRSQRSQSQLSADFQAICHMLEETDRAHADWRGSALFSPVRGPVNPFASHDPRGWFIGTVSYAACQYFDACDPVIFRLSELVVDNKVLAFRHPPPFLQDLRALRTYFQHGLDWNSEKDCHTRDVVLSWFKTHSGTTEPQREHWRGLCSAFLTTWIEMARQTHRAMSEALDALNREQIESELDRAGKRLPEHVWGDLVRGAATTLGQPIDTRVFVRTHMSALAEALKQAAPHSSALLDVARKIVERHMLRVAALPPVTGEDVIRAGFAPGPVVGKMLRAIHKLWERNPALTREELLTQAARDMASPAE